MAVYTKIFLKFPYKFWPAGNGTEFFLYAHEKRGYYTIWQVIFCVIKCFFYIFIVTVSCYWKFHDAIVYG